MARLQMPALRTAVGLPAWLLSSCVVAAICLTQVGCIAKPQFEPGPQDTDAPTEFTTTESGLQYRVLRRGNGKFPQASQAVRVHYEGRLQDTGTIFDSSYRSGEPARFGLRQVIPGWTEGMQLVDEGGMIELLIPSTLGYGADGVPGTIPPGATLRFIVELFEIH